MHVEWNGTNSSIADPRMHIKNSAVVHSLHIVHTVLISVLLVAGALGNMLTLTEFLLHPYLRVQRYLILADLTVTALLTCLLELVNVCAVRLTSCYTMTPVLLAILTGLVVLYGNLLMSVLLLAVDRFLTLFWPFGYGRWMTNKYLLLLILFTWAMSAMGGINFVLYSIKHLGQEVCYVYPPEPQLVLINQVSSYAVIVCAMLVLYGKILHLAKKQRQSIAQQQVGHTNSPSSSSVVHSSRGSRMILGVVTCYLALWLPHYAAKWLWTTKQSLDVYYPVFMVGHVLLVTNLITNNLLYAGLNSDFNKAYRAIFAHCRAGFSHTMAFKWKVENEQVTN